MVFGFSPAELEVPLSEKISWESLRVQALAIVRLWILCQHQNPQIRTVLQPFGTRVTRNAIGRGGLQIDSY